MSIKVLWVAGKVRGQLADLSIAWELQGVFDTEGAAVAACRSPKDFIGPVPLNLQLPQETADWVGCRFPLATAAEQAATEKQARSEPVNGIKATWFHDEGAYAQCSYCRRYTLDPKALGDRQPVCECGKKHGWSGSFKTPGPDAQWHGQAPKTINTAKERDAT